MNYWLHLISQVIFLSSTVSCEERNDFKEIDSQINPQLNDATRVDTTEQAQQDYVEELEIADSKETRLLQLARCAIKYCDPAQNALVECWADWWDYLSATSLTDERLEPERFLIYARARFEKRIPATALLEEFERILDQKYVLAFLARKSRRKEADDGSGLVCIDVKHTSPYYPIGLINSKEALIEIPASGTYTVTTCSQVRA